jgi:hypothetical protein
VVVVPDVLKALPNSKQWLAVWNDVHWELADETVVEDAVVVQSGLVDTSACNVVVVESVVVDDWSLEWSSLLSLTGSQLPATFKPNILIQGRLIDGSFGIVGMENLNFIWESSGNFHRMRPPWPPPQWGQAKTGKTVGTPCESAVVSHPLAVIAVLSSTENPGGNVVIVEVIRFESVSVSQIWNFVSSTIRRFDAPNEIVWDSVVTGAAPGINISEPRSIVSQTPETTILGATVTRIVLGVSGEPDEGGIVVMWIDWVASSDEGDMAVSMADTDVGEVFTDMAEPEETIDDDVAEGDSSVVVSVTSRGWLDKKPSCMEDAGVLSVLDLARNEIPVLLFVASRVWLDIELSRTVSGDVISIEDAIGADVVAIVSIKGAVVLADRLSCAEDVRLIPPKDTCRRDVWELVSVVGVVINELVEVVPNVGSGRLGADVSRPIVRELR